MKKLKKYSMHSPANSEYAFYLLIAENEGVKGNFEQAALYYDSAIESAAKYRLLHHEAMANELAAKFYFSKGRIKTSHTYMRDARYKYEKWGALTIDIKIKSPKSL